MRIGLIGRADLGRGLAEQTHAFARHMRPAKTLVIDHPATYAQDLTCFDPYSDATMTTPWIMPTYTLAPAAVDWLLSDIDVLFTVETAYDDAVIPLAESRSIPTVVQSNFEFCRWATEPDLARPTVIAFPTTWMEHAWPDHSILLPTPVDTARYPYSHRPELRAALHIGGHPAIGDRNGTGLISQLAGNLNGLPLTVTSQSQHQPPVRRGQARNLRENLSTEKLVGLYAAHDLLILPRHWGGQALSVNEALSSGMVVLMPNCPPYDTILPREMLFDCDPGPALNSKGGPIPSYRPSVHAMRVAINRFRTEPEMFAELSNWAWEWRTANSWSALKPVYDDLFDGLM